MLKVGQIQGGFFIFGVQTRLKILFFGASDTLTIIKNGLEMKNLCPPQSKRGKELKKTNHQTLNKGKFSMLRIQAQLVRFSLITRV
jgi:hypothetical protein